MVDQIVQIIPLSAQGYEISDVKVDDVSVGAVSEYTFSNIVEDHTLHAEFQIKTYTISPSASPNGSIFPESDVTVEYGSSKTFQFYPDDYYTIEKFYVDGILQPLDTYYTFENITESHTITVYFVANWLVGYDKRYSLIINRNKIPEDDSSIVDFPVYLDLTDLINRDGIVSKTSATSGFDDGTLYYTRSKSTGLKLVDFSEIIRTDADTNRDMDSVILNGTLLSMSGFPKVYRYFEWYEDGVPETVYNTPMLSTDIIGSYSHSLSGITSISQYFYRAVGYDGFSETWYGDWNAINIYMVDFIQTYGSELLSGGIRTVVKTIDNLEIETVQTYGSELLSGESIVSGHRTSIEADMIQTYGSQLLSGGKI